MKISKACTLSSLLLGALIYSSQSSGQEFGKLFTAPEERVYLDYLREDFLAKSAEAGFDIDQDAVPEIPVDDTDTAQESVLFYLGGVVSRAAGGKSVFLNGVSILEEDLPSNTSLVNLDGITGLRIESEGQSFILKPGQTLDISTGEFWEAFERPRNLPEQVEVVDEEISVSEITAGLTEVLPSTPGDLPTEIDGQALPPEVLEAILNADN